MPEPARMARLRTASARVDSAAAAHVRSAPVRVAQGAHLAHEARHRALAHLGAAERGSARRRAPPRAQERPLGERGASSAADALEAPANVVGTASASPRAEPAHASEAVQVATARREHRCRGAEERCHSATGRAGGSTQYRGRTAGHVALVQFIHPKNKS